jgi:SAM-dependent methyltransferase
MESLAENYLSQRDGLVLVDFGCGTMPYRPIFERYVTQYIGVDLPGNQAADLHVGLDGKTSLSDNCADVVVSTQLLEHIGEPWAYLRECYRLLKPNGLLILSTHGYWMFHPDPLDLWRWTDQGLRRTVEEVGFQIVHFQGLMGLASTSVHLLQDALMPKVPGFMKSLFSFAMQRIVMIADKIHSPSERTSVLVVVGRKPEG